MTIFPIIFKKKILISIFGIFSIIIVSIIEPKLIEKYNNLAREASSSGDKILSENYLQHADHFSRILSLQETIKMSNDNNNVIEQNFKKSVEEISSEKQEVENVKDIIKND